MPPRTSENVHRSHIQPFLRLLIPTLTTSAVIGQTCMIQDRLYGPQSHSSLLYRVQIIFESSGHAGDQVNVVVHTAAHAAVHQ